MTLDLLNFAGVESSRMVLFTSGACTLSKGNVANLKIEEFIRKHIDLEENKEIKARCDKAKEFYSLLASKMVA